MRLGSLSMRPTSHQQARSLFLLVTLVWFSLAIALKIAAANSGAFTSDLYDFHSALRSSAEGHFFRSYVYGNLMGDHATLLLTILIPFIFGTHHRPQRTADVIRQLSPGS